MLHTNDDFCSAKDLKKLRIAKGILFDWCDVYNAKYYPQTHVEFLVEIKEWADNPDDECILGSRIIMRMKII